VFNLREFGRTHVTNTQEPCAKPKGAKYFWLQNFGSPGLLSIVGPNSHKPAEGDQVSQLPVRSIDVGRFP
jgi:hypothetical protein